MGRLIFIGIIISIAIIVRSIEYFGQKARDKAAKSILKDFDYQKDKDEILGIGQVIKKKEIYCPICGGTLNVKRGKYGSFIGCSNYPDCAFTTNI